MYEYNCPLCNKVSYSINGVSTKCAHCGALIDSIHSKEMAPIISTPSEQALIPADTYRRLKGMDRSQMTKHLHSIYLLGFAAGYARRSAAELSKGGKKDERSI